MKYQQKRAGVLIICLSFSIFMSGQILEVDGKARILGADTVTTSTGDVVRLSDGTLGIRLYEIGDLAQGGMIFWIDETGEHGLVAALSDQSAGSPWVNDSLRITFANADGIGAGLTNTILILSQQTTGSNTILFAAHQCISTEEGGFGDWYLPSIEEMKLMHTNLHANGLGDFTSTVYWSSNEANLLQAWGVHFANGVPATAGKNVNYRVRAVRRF